MVNLRSHTTRLGVLDIGSNTIHMLIVDAAPGARPDPEASTKSTVRLMKYLKDDGSIKKSGIEAILEAVSQCMRLAEEYEITQLLVMATSALREAPNGNKVIHKIEELIGQGVTVLSGTDEARLCGAVMRAPGREDSWIMTREQLEDWIPRLAAIAPEQRVALPGITPERTMQIVGGGVVADEIMKALNIQEVEICPWALREGAILRWLDQFGRTRLGF